MPIHWWPKPNQVIVLSAEEQEKEKARKMHDWQSARTNAQIMIKLLQEGLDVYLIEYSCYYCKKCGRTAYPAKAKKGMFEDQVWPDWVTEECGTVSTPG